MRLENPVMLSSVMKRAVTVTPGASLLDAIDLLAKYGIKRLPVVKESVPVGIVTEKDLARAASSFNEKGVGGIRVGNMMSENLAVVQRGASVTDCARLMKRKGISSILVTNGDRTLAGIVTKTDLVGAFLVNGVADEKVSQVMTRRVVTVSPEEHLFVVQSVLVNNKISRVVVARNRRVVGIVTYRDFVPSRTVNWLAQYSDRDMLHEVQSSPRPNEFNAGSLSHSLTFRAEDIMTPRPLTIGSTETVFRSALLMVRHGISGLPVTHNGLLAGIITKSDLVGAMAEI